MFQTDIFKKTVNCRNSKYRYHISNEEKTCQPQLSFVSFSFPTLMYRTKLLQFAFLSSIYFLFLFLLMIRLRAHSRTIRKIYFRSSLDRHSKWRKREEDHQGNLFRTTTRNTDDGETAKRNNESQLIVEEKFRV